MSTFAFFLVFSTALLYKPVDRVTRSTLVLHVSKTASARTDDVTMSAKYIQFNDHLLWKKNKKSIVLVMLFINISIYVSFFFNVGDHS